MIILLDKRKKIASIHRNIDASVGSVKDLAELVMFGIRIDHVSVFK
jgi:hypothetical protein